jgi:uncharacterized Zn finger protein (UPF0148 family)
MLQGYTLKEKQCGKCGMPLMENRGKIDCVVCPALVKKAKKKMKAQQRLAEETVRLEQEIDSNKARQAREENRRHEDAARLEDERRERLALARAEQHQHELVAEKARKHAVVEEEKSRIASLEAEEARLLADARARADQEARTYEEQRQLSSIKGKDDKAALEDLRKGKQAMLEQEYAAASEKRRLEEIKLLDETRRLEEMEKRGKLSVATATENMKKDLLSNEHQKRLVEKAKLDQEILILEQERIVEVLECRMVAEEKRAEEEARMLMTLEEEAVSKAKAAEDAIRKAKAALEHVHSARRDVIAQTIALAEQEAVAEAESFIKSHREDYKAPVILTTASELKSEQWETLRAEGRSVMTRRVMAGWSLLAEFCRGTECENSPLITKNGPKECVVCGGCGDGNDGAYIVSTSVDEDDSVPTDAELQRLRSTGIHPDEISASGYDMPVSPTANQTFEEIQRDFETKRNMVSKEIGKRMIAGWTLLDSSCPQCVMPLMMDTEGTSDICVLCGLVTTIQNNEGSTIKPENQPIVTVPAAKEEPENQPIFKVPSAEETVPLPPHPNDMSTMESTLPTITESEQAFDGSQKFELPTAPTFEKETNSEQLAQSIRQSASRRPPMASPRGDPPASIHSHKEISHRKGSDPDDSSEKPTPAPFTISIPTDFDFSDDEAIKRLVLSAKNEDVHVFNTTEVSNNGEIYTAKNAMSAEAISDMILKSPMGYTAQQKQNINMNEIMDLVEIYCVTSFGETVSERIKNAVAADIKRKMEPPAPEADGIIHLESFPSPAEPKSFKFDMVDEEPETTESPSKTSTIKKPKPTPETMGCCKKKSTRATTPSGRGLPPRPDSGVRSVASSPRRSAFSPRRRNRGAPVDGGIVVVGDPSDFDDNKSFGEMSRAETVASETLDSILTRIDQCKTILLSEDADVESQLEAANLIEKLAQAAVAVKKLEDIGI